MTKEKQLRSGVILSYVNLALSSIIPLFYTPIMLNILGQAEYGLFSLSNSVIGYLSLLSFGFGSTVIRYITFYRAKGEKNKLENTFGFFLKVYSILAIIVVLCGMILSFNVDSVFAKGLTHDEQDKMRILMIIMAFNTAISFPISTFSSVVISHERYIFRKIVDMIATIAAPLSNLLMLYLGFASVGMALSNTILQVLVLPINAIYCLKVLKVRPRFGRIEHGVKKEMFTFSTFTFIATVVDMLFWATDKVILGMLTNTIVVAVYNIGATFNSMLVNLSSAMTNVLAPKVTSMVANKSSKSALSNLFIKVGRLQFIIVSLAVSGFVAFGQEFISLWAGDSFAESYNIALLTLIPLCVPLIQNTGLSILMAQNKHRFRSITYLIIAIVNVISTYLLVPFWGAIGAAVCSAISYIVGQGIIMNIYYYKKTGLDIPKFWGNIGRMSITPLIMVSLVFLSKNFIDYHNWITFFVGVALYTCCFLFLFYVLAFNQEEKSIIKKLFSPFKTLIKRIRNKYFKKEYH